jgi:type I restriction enzyme M protein
MLSKTILKLSQSEQEAIHGFVTRINGLNVGSREKFIAILKHESEQDGISLSATALKALVAAFGERNEIAEVCTDGKGKIEADSDLRDSENVPLSEDVDSYFKREVLPYAPDAWIDASKEKVGYEIPFTRHFYKYVPPRPLEEIDAELNILVAEIQTLLGEIEK